MAATDGTLRSGRLSALIADGDLRRVAFDGHEVLRRVSYPVRDADWGTMQTETRAERLDGGRYERQFRATEGAFEGVFRAEATGEARLVATVEIRFLADSVVYRTGFTLLNHIAGEAGTAVTVSHPRGGVEQATFPRLIAPAQPARDIVGLSHRAGPVAVDIAMAGDVFEMEDQRNWSDASYKTYCRPLSLPRPYPVRAGEVIRQSVTLTLSPAAEREASAAFAGSATAPLPEVLLAHEPGISGAQALAGFPGIPVLFRVSGAVPDAGLAALSGRDLSLEIVFADIADLNLQIARCRAAGLSPGRVVALPAGYLKSHQPEGPWPDGARPEDAFPVLRAAFPAAAIGGGSLTNFTELNRCRPDATAVDFLTFGNTAIVHAADDMSVRETLEAIPQIIGSATALAAGKPLHLGLLSIGMRSNPYGAGVAPNPERARLPMAMDDPRQASGFAAAYTVALLAHAAAGDVASLALAMPDGPLGAEGRPLADVVRRAAALAGRRAEITWQGALVAIETQAGGSAPKLPSSPIPFAHAPGGTLLPENAIIWGGAA